jgi:hypothetical protein
MYNTVDAITGATVGSYAHRSASWNGTDYNKTPALDGNYYVCMELTDANATGNYSCFPFTKGPSSDMQTPGNVPSFSNISIIWSPN